MTKTINELLEEFGDSCAVFTKEDYLKEKAELEKAFFEKHGLKPDEIKEAVRTFKVHCCDVLTERWIENEAFAPYLDLD